MTVAFAVTKEHDGPGVARLVLRGEIDHDVSEALAAIIVNAMDHEPLLAIVLDLRYVTFLAAAGVRSLLAGRAEAVRRGIMMRVTGTHGSVAFVLTTLAGHVDEWLSRPTGSPRPPCRRERSGNPSGATTRRPGVDLGRC